MIKKQNSRKKIMSSTAGFEPARAQPNRFQVCLLNHSDISTVRDGCVTKSYLLFLPFQTIAFFNFLWSEMEITKHYLMHFIRKERKRCLHNHHIPSKMYLLGASTRKVKTLDPIIQISIACRVENCQNSTLVSSKNCYRLHLILGYITSRQNSVKISYWRQD